MQFVAFLWICFAIAFVLAQFKLFSIDKTLKQISRQLNTIAPLNPAPGEAGTSQSIAKDVWACKNCGQTTAMDSGKPERCGFCGAKEFEQKTIQVKANPA